MGLLRSCLEIIAPHMRGARVLSLGYPDLVIDAGELGQVLNLSARFPLHPKTGYPETVAVFAALGSTIECIDIFASRGVERIVDLNCEQALGEWDLVLDAGTTEHCFNIGQALMNAANAVRPGGRIFHTPPASMVNHGFYNLCPTLFSDFYSQNGWQIETLHARANKGRGAMIPTHRTTRFKLEPETVLHCLARRPESRDKLEFPKQTKYLLHEPGTKR